MFAPKIAKPQTKTAADLNSLTRPRSTLTAQRHSPVEQALLLQRTIGNQATMRLLSQRVRNLTENEPRRRNEQERDLASVTAREATPGVSWDFSRIPLFPPDRRNQPQAPSAFPRSSLQNIIQPKLTIGQVNDPLEHEADRIADQVMRMPISDLSLRAAPLKLSRKCAACEGEERAEQLRSKLAGPSERAASEAPPIVHGVLRSPGRPLDPTTRAFFEPRFGHDLSGVRIHTGPQAARSAQAVNSFAYTVGRNIVFAAERYTPSTYDGARLLAHELTHVMQQQGADPAAASAESNSPAVQLQRQDDGTDQVAAGDDQTNGMAFVPAPVFPGAPADAFICGRSLHYPVLNLVVGHSYIKAPPDNYGIVAPLCTPTDGGSDNLLLGTAAQKRDNSCDPGSDTPECIACRPKRGVTDVKKCLRNAFDGYNSPTMHKALGPNSNTLAGTLARACCADVTSNAPFSSRSYPGWGDPPAPARPATCPPGPPDCT
jgi:Domain of unknown function (DUF4157)